MFHYSKSKQVNFAKIYEKANKIYKKLPPVKKHKRKKVIIKIIKAISLLAIFAFLAVLFFLLINFANLKFAYQSLLQGKENAEYSISLFNEKKYDEAVDFAKSAKQNFSSAGEKISELRSKIYLRQIVYLEEQLNDLQKLSAAGEVLSQAMVSGSKFGASLADLGGAEDTTFTAMSKVQKQAILKRLHESGPELNGIKANIDLALVNLESIKYIGLFHFLKDKLIILNGQLSEARNFLAAAVPASQLVPSILGYPEKSAFLVMLQNSDELRPTGGFLGTYGILELDSGEITRFDTHDIYHMDMPVKDKVSVAPPLPLSEYLGVDKWYLRDANWSPDWPEAARKIEWFYHEENKYLSGKDQINNFDKDFDGVIGITPDLIVDLLSLSGPVKIEGNEYNKDNFMGLLEYRVEQGYEQLGIPAWERKEIIGQIAAELKSRILNLPANKLYQAFNLIMNNLNRKNIILYLSDPQLESLITDQNWGGELRKAKDDYLMVVDSNMASYKTDAVIARNISYQLDQSVSGVFARLTINYSHSGGFDWRTTRYRTYVRAYAPLGSELLQVKGVSGKINKWDESTVNTTEELGKTVFSTFIEIEPGEIGSLEFYYKLPAKISDIIKAGQYDLYVQKQPGSKVDSLNLKMNFSAPILSYGPIGFNAFKSDNNISWDSDLNQDKEFLVNF